MEKYIQVILILFAFISMSCNGEIKPDPVKAAEILDVSPRKINYLINKYNITHPNWRKNNNKNNKKWRF